METKILDKDLLISSLATIKSYYQKGLYKTALEYAYQNWGPASQWQHLQQILVGSRLFMAFGLRRKGYALRYKLWRKYPNHPEALHYYLSTILDRKGPLKALEFIRNIGDLKDEKPAVRAEWLNRCSQVYEHYRDWESAEAAVLEAESLKPNDQWIIMQKAGICEKRDEYDLAWQTIQPMISKKIPPVIRYAAHLKSIVGDTATAIDLLKPLLSTVESISLALQLYTYSKQVENIELAQVCVDRARALLSGNFDGNTDDFLIAEFELAYLRNDFFAAENALANAKSPYFKKIRANILAAPDDAQKRILNVPFVRQHHMTCAPATLSALCLYWGEQAEHLGIVESICYDGTPNHAERRWCQQQGWVTVEFELTFSAAKALIDNGVPFTLSTVDPGSAHLQAVIGYDTRKGVYLIRDPYFPSVQEFLCKEFGENYISTGPRCLAFVPKEKQHLIDGIELSGKALYDLNFQLIEHLENHQREDAQAVLKQMQALTPDHRLTWIALRSLARYNNDNLSELGAVEKLLEKFPDDLNLQASKANLLGCLGRFQDQLIFLEEVTQHAYPHPYIVESLINCLRQDNRRAKQTAAHIQYVLYRQPTNAGILWEWASLLWEQEKYEDAYVYYRLCTKLEEKREGYINSYFKAARFLKRTVPALKELTGRVETLGKYSYLPFESLYYAYRSLDRDQESLEVLVKALDIHPKEQDLISLAVHAHLYTGKVVEAKNILQSSCSYLSDISFTILSAAIAKHLGDWEQQEKLNAHVLDLQPLNYDIIEEQAMLLGKHYGDEKTLEFIDSRLALNASDRYLLFLRSSWLSDAPVTEREDFARKIVALHPRDVESNCRLAKILLEQRKLAEAKLVIDLALSVDPNNHRALTVQGDIYLSEDNTTAAQECYKKIVRLQVDTEDIFSRLLKTATSPSEKCDLLTFVHSELMRQTSYGNGIMEYRDVAREIIPDEDLLNFLNIAVEQREDLWHAWVALALHLVTMDRLDQALVTIQKALDKFPLLPRLHLEKANIHFLIQEYHEAETCLLEALKLSPQWIRAITRLSDLYEAQNNYDKALEVVQKALHHSPNNSILLGYAADFYRLQGKYELVLESLEKALEYDFQYDWAWEKYHETALRLKKNNAAIDLCSKLLQRMPYSATLWQKLAMYTENPEEKFSVLEKALSYLPKDEQLNLQLCRYYYTHHQIENIKRLVKDTKWQQQPPPSIMAYEAWVDAEHQHYERAIKCMLSILDMHPAYYDGWRLLSVWSQKLGRYGDSVKYVDTCVRLYPHAPDTLTLAAETYLKAIEEGEKLDKKIVGQYLRKAVFIQPRDYYNGQTWVDFLLEEKDVEGLKEAKEILQETSENPYYWVRFLKVAILLGDIESAFEYFEKILACDEDGDWLFHNSYQSLLDAGEKHRLYSVLKGAIADDTNNKMVGELWARYCLENEANSEKKVFEYIDAIPSESKFWAASFESYLDPSHYGKITEKIIRKYGEQFKKQPRLWSLVVFYYVNKNKTNDLLRWSEGLWNNTENNAWAVYMCGLFVRGDNRWGEARKINAFAYELPEDDYYDRVLLWKNIDDYIFHNKPIDADEVARIRIQELAEVEQYCYELLLALYSIQNEGSIAAAEPYMLNKLRDAPLGRDEAPNSNIGKHMKKCVKKTILSQIEGGFWERLRWQIRLFHLL